MKKISFVILVLLITLSFQSVFAQVGIGTVNPDASAILDLQSNEKGLLPPRLTTAERDAIADPAIGLTIFNTDNFCLEWFIGIGWKNSCDDNVNGTLDSTLCDNDISNGTGSLVAMQYNYTGVYNTATYTWCAREVSAGGHIWLDRNLGAYKVADSVNDAASYGDFYQWGRANDGHAKRFQRNGDPLENSGTQGQMANGTTTTNANYPASALYIIESNTPFDWRITPNDFLWENPNQNNPCPSGFRLPTFVELVDLNNSFVTQNSIGAFNSPIKLPSPGWHSSSSGSIFAAGVQGLIWSSEVLDDNAIALYFSNGTTPYIATRRSFGLSIRCIKQ